MSSLDNIPFVSHFFKLSPDTQKLLRSLESPFPTPVGEIVYYRTYSRKKENGQQEHWPDTVIRVTEGTFSVRKDYYIKHRLRWIDDEWQKYAKDFALSMYWMKFLPPGRGLWAMGTEYMFQRGSAALNNCGACVTVDMIKGATWTMDMLMCGVGVGVSLDWDGNAFQPDKTKYEIHVVADSREGWVDSLRILLQAYIPDENNKTKKFPKFDYSEVRKQGEPVKGFGGTASGPGPLQDLHFRVEWYLDTYLKYKETHATDPVAEMFTAFYQKGFYLSIPQGEEGENIYKSKLKQIKYNKNIVYDKTRCAADIINSIGVCVVAGNIRRSAEIVLGNPEDNTFLNLKNYQNDPSREDIGWMSNNSVKLEQTWQFSQYIPQIADRIRNNGEPGIVNFKNIRKYGRYGKEAGQNGLEIDEAVVSNPCITGDSLVYTNQGFIPVKDLVGVQFTALHPRGDLLEYPSTEKGFWETGIKNVYLLILENGMNIKATANHKFFSYSSDEWNWIELQDLTTSDLVMTLGNKGIKIDSINYVGQEIVYDCSIPGINSFYANGILGHNCGEIGLESGELCNLSECFPSRCIIINDQGDEFIDEEELKNALEFATFYSSTVSLLPTQSEMTNKIIAKNRRIGVSLSGIADVYDRIGHADLTRLLRLGYIHVRETNTKLAKEAGVPVSIRLTTVKPSGSISQLAGVSPGMHFPTFKYAIRRIMVSSYHPITKVLIENKVPYEESVYTPDTLTFSFPINQERTRAATDVSMWEQFSLLAMLQREWSDNMVSCTIYFDPKKEGNQIEHALAQFIPLIKSVSMLPHTSKGAYAQAPYEGITEEQYNELSSKMKKIDWSNYGGSDGQIPKFCTNDVCEI